MTSSETKIGLAPFANWYSNYCSDVWSSPSFFENPSNSVISPRNEFIRIKANGLLAYGARNCVIINQIHGTTIRFTKSIKAFPSLHEKVITVAFARCLKTPKLFIGSNQGKVMLYHLERNVHQTLKEPPGLTFNAVIAAADWSDDVHVYYSKGYHVIQWNTESNDYFVAELAALSDRHSKIDAIKVTKVDPLLLAVAFSGGKISILKLDGSSITNYSVLTHLNHGSNEILSLAFPFCNGDYENGVLAAISRNGSLKVWELDSKKILAEQHFAVKSDKSKSKNFFSLSFVPKPPPSTTKEESNEVPKENKITESDSTQSELSESVEICNTPEKPTVKENDNFRHYVKLLASRADGKIVIMDIPVDKRETSNNSLKRPETICGFKVMHHNVVFNISVINPFHYISNGGKRSLQPFWTMRFFASSIGLDRAILIYDLRKIQSVRPIFPTISLQVHDLDFRPNDYSKLLIACGDGLKIWKFNHNVENVGRDGPASYQVENVPNVPPSTKIVSASWHPHDKTDECVIGFGTEDGSFICIELNKQIILYLDESKVVGVKSRIYSCKWGPIPSDYSSSLTRNWACYTVYAVGTVLAHVVTDSQSFNIDELSDGCLTRQNKSKTECVWKDDYNYIAVGYVDGQIMICVNDGHFKLAIILNVHTTLVSCIRWHPDNIHEYDEKNKNKIIYKEKTKHESWIASGSKDITVQLTDLKMHLLTYHASKTHEAIHLIKPTQTLFGHQDGIVSISWNMVSEDLLATCSADTTVQVWHVELAVPLYVFRGHWSRVFAVSWAPWDGNLIFSAGDDSTVQVWSPVAVKKNLIPTLVDELLDIPRIDSPLPEIDESSPQKNGYQQVIKPVPNDDEQYSIITSSCDHDTSQGNQILDSTAREIVNFPEGKIVKKITSASSESQDSPKVSPDEKKTSSNQPSRRSSGHSSTNHSDVIINRLRNSEKNMPEVSYKDKKKSLLPRSNFVENCSTKLQTLQDIEFLLSKRYEMTGIDGDDKELRTRNLIFLDKDEINEICQIEISNHKQNKNFPLAFQISALQGNLKDMITEAVKTSQLSDWMVSQAASISREFWAKTVLAYAVQLEKSGDSFQSALYYSTIHRIIDATRVLVKAGQYKEALILVKSREPYNSQLVKDILHAWAELKQKDTNFEFAAKVYVANMETDKASICLGERLDDPKCQQLKRTIDSAQSLKLDEEKDPDPPVTKLPN